MARLLHWSLSIPWRKWSSVFLAFCWCGGLALGIRLFDLAGEALLPLMHLAVFGRVSMVSLLMTNLLPFLFSAFAVYIRMPGLLYGCAFCKGCLFSFVSMGTIIAFGTAGWLVRLLLMFSDICLTVLLYAYWLGHVSGLRLFSGLHSSGYAAAALLIGSFDHCIAAPFLVRLIDF